MAEIAIILVALVVAFLFYRYFVTHARREVFRHTVSRRAGQSYSVRPMQNSGWYIVALIVLAVIFILVVVK